MRLFKILILLLSFCASCKSQKLSKSLKSDVVDFYIDIDEIQRESEQELLKNFEEIFTITDFKNKRIKHFQNKKGLYKVSPNISHTTTHIILCSDSECTVLKANIQSLSKIIDFIKNKDDIDKINTIRYIDSFLKLIKENKEINESNAL